MVYKVIGLMSGSSLDGLDIAYVHLQERAATTTTSGPRHWDFSFVHTACYPYSDEWKRRLAEAPGLSALDYQLLHVEYGRYLGEQVLRFIEEFGLHYQVQLIASHGHTVFHRPDRKMTAQLGDGAALSAVTRISVVSDLRAMDMALGGQGAPIVPIGEKLLLPGYDYFLNLGGIANISQSGRAFDVCPANRVLNSLAATVGKAYDEGGAMAATGRVDEALLKRLNALPYYDMGYPKSLGNEFGTETVVPMIREAMGGDARVTSAGERNLGASGLGVEDALRTYTEHIVVQIRRGVESLGGEKGKMLVTGGGAHNNFLVRRLREALAPTGVEVVAPAAELIDYKEALVMALIGVLRWREENNVLASVTGASRDSVGGAVWIGQAVWLVLLCLGALVGTGQGLVRAPLTAGSREPVAVGSRAPLTADFSHSAAYRWLNKKVLESRNLDDMEDLSAWKGWTMGADPIIDARAITRIKEAGNVTAISLSAERVHDGAHSLLLRMPTRLPGPGPVNGRGWGHAGIRRVFEGQDWTAYNRLSLWIYPDLPGFFTTALDMQLYNDGVEKLPALFGQEGMTSIILRNHEWNHVVWEIGNVARDKITGFEVAYGLSGSAPGEADSIRFFFDRLDLEKVDPDKVEGWDVWPGRISYSQEGYQPGAEKIAMLGEAEGAGGGIAGARTAGAAGTSGVGATGPAGGGAATAGADRFELIDQESGEVVFTKPIQTVDTHVGNFRVMDFSPFRKEGKYVLKAGSVTTEPFAIGEGVWEASILKAINFFYMERCGAAIPGVHGVCHRDWICTHNDKKIVMNGGWHDAGDLSTSIGGNSEISYGLFSLAERIHARGGNPVLYDRAIEEAKWGLDWMLKTRFGDGYRVGGGHNSRRTDDIIGDDDDLQAVARNTPMENFVGAAAEAIAARVLKESDPRLAAQSLQAAREDWQFGVEGMKQPAASTSIWTGTFDSDNIAFEVAAEGILAAVDLWKVTGDPVYEEKAAAWSQLILRSQQRKRTDWDVPLTGWFYTSPEKDRLLHFVHRGRQQAHILALTELCSAFPDHPDWMKWYSAVTLYSEYLTTIARYTGPYQLLPASIYSDTEYLKVPESRRASFRQQVLKGIPLGKGHYLRLFPVWMDYRGNFGTILPEAQALVNAAHLRGDLPSARLATHQLEWIIGRNPFAQSAMWGEGYDFTPLYTPSSGHMAGALPVGIETKGDNDVPYWPAQSTWTYKEVWSHPTARWIWLLRDLSGPALVEGMADGEVVFADTLTRGETVVRPEGGMFRVSLPEGNYVVRSRGVEMNRSFLPAQDYRMDLRLSKTVSFEVVATSEANGWVTIRVNARGEGAHRFSLRVNNLAVSGSGDNLATAGADKDIVLRPGVMGTVEWKAKVQAADEPWVLVVVADGDLGQKKERMGGF